MHFLSLNLIHKPSPLSPNDIQMKRNYLNKSISKKNHLLNLIQDQYLNIGQKNIQNMDSKVRQKFELPKINKVNYTHDYISENRNNLLLLKSFPFKEENPSPPVLFPSYIANDIEEIKKIYNFDIPKISK